MKIRLITLSVTTALVLAGCNTMQQSDAPQVTSQPAAVHTTHAMTAPKHSQHIERVTIKHAPGMVPLVTQADVKTSQKPHAMMQKKHHPQHIVITETNTGNPLVTGMITLNNKAFTLNQAIGYLSHIEAKRQALLAKNSQFVNAIDAIYVGKQKLSPAQTKALLQYMHDQHHPISYQGLNKLPLHQGVHVALHLEHIKVNGQALTGPAAIAFVNGLVAQEQLKTQPPTHHTVSTRAPQHHGVTITTPTTMPKGHHVTYSNGKHQIMMQPHSAAPTTHTVTTIAPTQQSNMHNVMHGIPMHHAVPPTPASPTPTTSVVDQPQAQGQ